MFVPILAMFLLQYHSADGRFHKWVKQVDTSNPWGLGKSFSEQYFFWNLRLKNALKLRRYEFYISISNPAEEKCTGNFVEADPSNSGNGKQRPAPGTRCVGKCIKTRGARWGESFCYTDKDKSNWGAECVRCPGLL